MNLSEKKDFIIKQLENIQDEVVMDGIIEYITVKNEDIIKSSVDNFFEKFANEHDEVLAKLAL